MRAEDAQNHLKTLQVKWEEGFEARLQGATPEAAEIARGIREVTGHHHHLEAGQMQALQRKEEALKALLPTLTPQERTRVFEVFFPRMAETVEQGWQLLQTLPYQVGYSRKSFRAPGHPAMQHKSWHWLVQLWHLTRSYDQDLVWFAGWAGRLGSYWGDEFGYLFAGAINHGNSQVLSILKETAAGEHEVGLMGRHVTRALLTCNDPEAWAFVTKLLLAAQRQEGLRQVVLETIDEAHPQAFVKMVQLVLDEDLLRFSAALRAAALWLGMGYDATDKKTLHKLLQQFLTHLQDPQGVQEALQHGNGQQVYLALWATAFQDALRSVELGAQLLTDPDPERRYAALLVIKATDLPEGRRFTSTLLQDSDLRIASQGINDLRGIELEHFDAGDTGTDLYDLLCQLAERLPQESRLDPLVWPWTGWVASQQQAYNMLPDVLGQRPFADLLPFLPRLDTWQHRQVLRDLPADALEDGPFRAHLIQTLAHTDEYLRSEAFHRAGKLVLTGAEIGQVEGLFARKSADLRQKALQLLLLQPHPVPAEAAGRLTRQGKTHLRQAGLQLLQALVDQHPRGPEVQDTLREVLEHFVPKNPNETQLFEHLRTPDTQLSLEDGLGLIDLEQRTPLVDPVWRERQYLRPELLDGLQELEHLLEAHKDTEVKVKTYGDEEQVWLLGNLEEHRWYVRLDQQDPFPLAEVWQGWWHARPHPRPEDLLQLEWMFHNLSDAETEAGDRHPLLAALTRQEGKFDHLTGEVLKFLGRGEVPAAAIDFLLDASESHLSLLDPQTEPEKDQRGNVRDPRGRISQLRRLGELDLKTFTPDQLKRYWQLSQHYQQGFRHLHRGRVPFLLLLEAWKLGLASENDVLYHLIGSQKGEERTRFQEFSQLTARKPHPLLETHPELVPLVNRVRDHVLTVEKGRADLPTGATHLANSIRSLEGAEHTLFLLAGLGKESMTRGAVQHVTGKTATFSHLIRVSFPGETDTQQAFSARVKEHGLTDARLLELAVYAPQWAPWVEKQLQWQGLTSAIYWMHAHTRDTGSFVDGQVRETWEAEITERTPLTAQDLLEGAVDVHWFRTVMQELGEKRFAELQKASRYLSSTGAQKRAELYARAILGQATEAELQGAVKSKRHQDSVRALGLLPAQNPQEVLSRYRILQAFLKESRQFGAQRQASEGNAVRIGMDNLARGAGYPDPQRLMWAMETLEVQDLLQKTVQLDGVTITLQVDLDGDPFLTVLKKDRPLKSIPAALKKHPEVQELTTGKVHLQQQKTRMREAFEGAMVRGDHFSKTELVSLHQHPVARPMLQNLVWVQGERDLGLIREGGFQGLQGSTPLTDEGYRLAHPHDLLTSGHWRDWQKLLFDQELTQPFKQVFREHYLLTSQEADQLRSTRYEGQQLNPRQALALLKTRNWVTVPEAGARKTFHLEGISAWLDFQEGFYTPLDIEGLTVSHVVFTERGSFKPLPLGAVPPRVFSETLRDVDLVVSVAHVGGVDPEASQSTVEMRRSLIQETLRLMKLQNVTLQAHHAQIQGHHADYSVHLGSGTVHRQPGGALCILPVHSQHRGRIFLPFADNDPKTAEVVSKVLLLARDSQIQDPTILEQLA